MVLPRLTVLDKRYAIGRALDATEPLVFAYQAWNLHTEDQVLLEEFFPTPLVHRQEGSLEVEALDAAHDELFRYGRDQFLKEAVVLASVNHPNLMDVQEHFENHNTVYRVQAYHKGATLASVLAKQGGKLPVKTAFTILLPLLEGLHVAHQRGLIHGAFAPQAVFLAKGRGPMLRSFRTTHVMMAQRTTDRQHLITDGISAPEQYEAGGRQGPWTDVYGSAATLFQMLTGHPLPAVPQRLEHDEVPALLKKADSLPEAVREVLEQAVSLDSARRPRSAQSFHQRLVEAVKQSAKTQAAALAEKPAAQASETPAPAPKPEPKAAEAAAPVKAAPPKTADAPPPVVATAAEAAPKQQAPPKPQQPVVVSEERADWAAQEMAAQAAQKQAAQKQAEKLVVQKLAAKKKAADAVEEEANAQKSKRQKKAAKKQPSADRQAVRSRRRGMPVLAALVAVVLVALSGAYVLMQGERSGLAQFAHYKAQADSLFAVANYMEAKTQYEYALAAAPNNEYIAGRLNETQQRLIEVQEVRYTENMARGDVLFAQADSLLTAGDALAALSVFAEANKAFYEALRYRPDDPVLLEKGQQTSIKMEEALSYNQQETGEPAESVVNAQAMRQQLFNSYREQGDQLFARGDYAGARAKYVLAEKEWADNRHVVEKIKEIDDLLAVTGRDKEFEQYIELGTELLGEERYAEAQITFRQALDIKPGDQRALDGMNRAGSMLDQAKRNENYQRFREQGDALLAEGAHAEAKTWYERALTARPSDAYVQQKIAEIEQHFEDQRQAEDTAQVVQAPDDIIPEDGIYTVVDEAPELIGGLKELHNQVEYPRRAIQVGVQGRVYVQFVVTEDGEVEDARVIRGIGEGCDEEAVRVVQAARFIPGKLKGRPVKVRHTLFITFKLK